MIFYRRDSSLTWMQLAWALGYQQPPDAEGAERAAREALRLQPGYTYKRALTELQKMKTTSAVAIVVLSSIYAAQGEKESALAELERALSSGYRDFVAIDANPYLSSLRPDPRFQQLLQRFR